MMDGLASVIIMLCCRRVRLYESLRGVHNHERYRYVCSGDALHLSCFESEDQMNDNLRLKQARRLVKAELDSYDLLSKPAKIRYERHIVDAIDANAFGPERGYVCGHNISLCAPCDKCKRSADDCKTYQVALESRLKALLSQLK